MALLVFITFGIGLLSLTSPSNTDAKLVPLGVHMALGIIILVLVIVRYLMRILVYKPSLRPASPKKQIFLDQVTPYVHLLLYAGTALMALLGLAIALPADLFSIVWGRSGLPLPADFYVYPARALHGTLSLLLLVLIAQHVLVAVFHQFIKGENYLGRMWFTRRDKDAG
jgi:cytochrome b561